MPTPIGKLKKDVVSEKPAESKGNSRISVLGMEKLAVGDVCYGEVPVASHVRLSGLCAAPCW